MGEGTLIQLDGVPTYFVDSGGTRTPLLLIHGSGPGIDGPMSWAPVIDDLNHRWHIDLTRQRRRALRDIDF